jgi:hypothetical protein
MKKTYLRGPHSLLAYPADLNAITGKPTGQGFGAARKGPSVKGPIQDAVVDYSMEEQVVYTEKSGE